ncbi:uncharacterized protein LOC120183417 [Hibiscus syriacus]|uniref:uncharacterized protein LOC120183417 n=1 Tax=Hibiscus syriacus TaxID=106335 RepID=UPI0019235E8C|nr:uncharacterized protein LOC120183417 [Hibiscus syriacus]
MISQLCMRYFWKGQDSSTGGAKISWQQVSSLKSEDGLGLEDVFKLRPEVAPVFTSASSLHRVKAAWIWGEIRVKYLVVSWYKLIWFPLHVPKHAINAWFVILDRLSTLDKLLRMNLTVDPCCPICGFDSESRDHLFFICSLSCEVRTQIWCLCGLRRNALDWTSTLAWAYAGLKGKSLLEFILKLAWNTHIY